MRILFAVPLKPFAVSKARLAEHLESAARARLMRAVAGNVVRAAVAAGGRTAVVTADPEVARWAGLAGADVIPDPPGGGLDGAAAAAAEEALRDERAWCIVHGDLPLLTAGHLTAVLKAVATGRPVIAPSRTGGTSLLASREPIDFAYGPGSFHRHLAALRPGPPQVLVHTGTALDLDTAADLAAAASLPGGAWLAEFLERSG